MIRAMDIVHTAEKIMSGGRGIDPTKSIFLVPGAFVTADIPKSGDKIYQVISLEGQDIAKIKNIETKKIYLVPTEFLSMVLINDPFSDIDSIKNFKNDKDDKDPSSGDKVNRIGIKKPEDPEVKDTPEKAGVYLIGGQAPYSRSRYDRSNQFSRSQNFQNRKYDK